MRSAITGSVQQHRLAAFPCEFGKVRRTRDDNLWMVPRFRIGCESQGCYGREGQFSDSSDSFLGHCACPFTLTGRSCLVAPTPNIGHIATNRNVTEGTLLSSRSSHLRCRQVDGRRLDSRYGRFATPGFRRSAWSPHNAPTSGVVSFARGIFVTSLLPPTDP